MNRILSVFHVVVVLAVAGSLAMAAGRTFWHLAGQSAVMPAPATSGPEIIGNDGAPVEIASALALAPFGTTVASEPDPQAAVDETSLDMVLSGVVLNATPSLSYAMITHDGITRSYPPGDAVTDRVTLMDISERQVLLNVDGQEQTLSFPNAGRDAPPATDAADAPETAAKLSGLNRLRAALGVGSGSIEVAPPPPPETTQDYIDMWRERITRNPGEVLDEIGLIPAEDGYRVAEDHDRGVKLAGLRAGDRVATVNGQAVGDIERDRKFYDQVAASGVARLEVVREGETLILSFPLQ